MGSRKLRSWGYADFFARKLILMVPDPGKASRTPKMGSLTPKIDTFLIIGWGYLLSSLQMRSCHMCSALPKREC